MSMHIYSKHRQPTSNEQLQGDLLRGVQHWALRQEWTDTPYGRRKPAMDVRLANGLFRTVTRLQIDPGKDTSIGTKAIIDQFGLKAHPGVLVESIKVRCEEGSLLYTWRDLYGEGVDMALYGNMDAFESIGPNGRGYWNTLTNLSTETVHLRIDAIRRVPKELLRK